MKLGLWIALIIGSLLYHLGMLFVTGRPFNFSEFVACVYWTGFAYLVLFFAERAAA